MGKFSCLEPQKGEEKQWENRSFPPRPPRQNAHHTLHPLLPWAAAAGASRRRRHDPSPPPLRTRLHHRAAEANFCRASGGVSLLALRHAQRALELLKDERPPEKTPSERWEEGLGRKRNLLGVVNM